MQDVLAVSNDRYICFSDICCYAFVWAFRCICMGSFPFGLVQFTYIRPSFRTVVPQFVLIRTHTEVSFLLAYNCIHLYLHAPGWAILPYRYPLCVL